MHGRIFVRHVNIHERTSFIFCGKSGIHVLLTNGFLVFFNRIYISLKPFQLWSIRNVTLIRRNIEDRKARTTDIASHTKFRIKMMFKKLISPGLYGWYTEVVIFLLCLVSFKAIMALHNIFSFIELTIFCFISRLIQVLTIICRSSLVILWAVFLIWHLKYTVTFNFAKHYFLIIMRWKFQQSISDIRYKYILFLFSLQTSALLICSVSGIHSIVLLNHIYFPTNLVFTCK